MKKVNDSHHLKNAHPQTAAIRCGYRRTAEREHSEAIFATSSFVFDDAAHAAALFADELPGNVYSRFTNPTVRAFENRLAALEGGRFGVATASGMAAVCALLLGLLKSGDRVVASNELFGASVSTFTKVFSRFRRAYHVCKVDRFGCMAQRHRRRCAVGVFGIAVESVVRNCRCRGHRRDGARRRCAVCGR